MLLGRAPLWLFAAGLFMFCPVRCFIVAFSLLVEGVWGGGGGRAEGADNFAFPSRKRAYP